MVGAEYKNWIAVAELWPVVSGLARGEGGVVWAGFDAVERLRSSLRISVPGGKGLGQHPSALHLDRPGAQGVCPSKLTQMPFGERHGIVHHDHQMLLAARVFLANLGVPRSISSQPRLPGPDSVG